MRERERESHLGNRESLYSELHLLEEMMLLVLLLLRLLPSHFRARLRQRAIMYIFTYLEQTVDKKINIVSSFSNLRNEGHFYSLILSFEY